MSTRTLALLLAGVGLALGAGACGTATPAPTAPADAATSGGPADSADPVARQRLADDGAFPFQVALLNLKATDDAGEPAADDLGRFSCGGSLLDDRHVLTAGHCFAAEGENPPDPVKDFRVVAGRATLTGQDGQVRGIAQVQVHPRYSTRPIRYDVAVITLDEPVTGLEPITLVRPGDTSLEQGGAPATFTGWGSPEVQRDGEEYSARPYSERLKQVDVPVLDDDDCLSAYRKNEDHAAPNMRLSLCTSTADEIGHCHGDSGSPLFVTAESRFVQLGVVSFAPGCGDPRYPSVYARLSDSDINAFITEAVGSGG